MTDYWQPGTYVRHKNTGQICKIGHIVEDKWQVSYEVEMTSTDQYVDEQTYTAYGLIHIDVAHREYVRINRLEQVVLLGEQC